MRSADIRAAMGNMTIDGRGVAPARATGEAMGASTAAAARAPARDRLPTTEPAAWARGGAHAMPTGAD